MKFLKKYNIFEKEFDQSFFKKNPNFYLNKNKIKSFLFNPSDIQNIELDELKDILKKLNWQDLKVELFDESDDPDYPAKIYWVKLPENIKRKIYEYNPNKNAEIKFTVEDFNYNRIHTDNVGIHRDFRGLGLGYKQYKALIKHLGWIRSSVFRTTDESRNVWNKIIQDPDFYIIIIKNQNPSHNDIENDGVIAIYKKLEKSKIREIVNLIESNFSEIELDSKLKALLK